MFSIVRYGSALPQEGRVESLSTSRLLVSD